MSEVIEDFNVRKYLETISEMSARNMRAIGEYHSLEEFVLKNGVEFPHETVVLTAGTIKECFRNAALLALENDNMIYCEGWALGAIVPVLHAWCWDKKEKRVVEATWGFKGTGYIGVPFDTDWLLRWLNEREVYGVIDCSDMNWAPLRLSKESLGKATVCIEL